MKNLALLTDLYEYSMANGFQHYLPQTRAVFDVFFRKVPDKGGLVVAAGLQQIVEQLQNFNFSADDLEYFRSLKLWDEDFLQFLANFKLDCQISAVPEGMPVFPREPLITVSGPIAQAQLLETLILNIFNHQSLIATKSRRMTQAAQGKPIMEFGARRAQGPDSALYGTRAAVIGGASSTSNVLAAKKFHIPAAGTMAHSWIEAFPDELSAFRKWAALYPDNAALLVDTYDVLQSGVPHAIQVFQELQAQGHQPLGIRIDSGDIASLTQKSRALLDEAGLTSVKITISNALDENIITSLLQQQAPIDNFGIGEKLITSSSAPVLSGVYKLAAIEQNGQLIPKIKVSNDLAKLTIPGPKKVYRLYYEHTQEAFADVIALANEDVIHSERITVVNSNPLQLQKPVVLTNFVAQPLLHPLDFSQKHPVPTDVFAIQRTSQRWLDELPIETKRLTNPDIYPVYMTEALNKLQKDLIAH
ncbi:nicotinate phosphoribosyltransferase [Lactobacillus sp. W8089]|nr:nicotinate phosphoribosyltransferase [Lactobacillus sp. W8086]MBI0108689.1 nicotinate phosphoribosyltransferase [Lactobacillus sp. W8085]MBI0111906.1 nicotinate phosphoribosyltransferase [Lactobacillus sp. W8088]MBI0115622.1 nicotinate phosphoribosyltransferase [Lactobacillus sp. W8087]MBI0119346.1 nicotinate phosphoribosyltransferase [Lactobacillus sp. W8089]MBI0131312.1 nicotinate phosphoribosyltransferase [Lactobacillus sp. W8090]